MSVHTQHFVQCWLRRLTENGVPRDGWEATGAGVRQPVEYIRERSQDYKLMLRMGCNRAVNDPSGGGTA